MGAYNEVLINLVWRLPFLLPGAHKPTTGQDIFLYLRKVDLDHHALLPSVFVPDLGHSISRATNF